jgi:hypothetical protein
MDDITQVNIQTAERPGATRPAPRGYVPVEDVSVSRAPERGGFVLPLAVALVLFVGSLLLNSLRTMQAVDLTADETTYAIESVAMHRVGTTRWNGAPFYVHPPLFFLTEGLAYKAVGVGSSPFFDRLMGGGYVSGEPLLAADAPLTEDNMLRAIEIGRYLNALYGALLTVVIFFLGRALHSWQLGLLGAAVFALDPYVVWRHHFNYLEPLATLLGVLSIFMYFRAFTAAPGTGRRRYLLLSGLFLGLAMLSKELAVLFFVGMAAHWLLFRRVRFGELLVPFGIGMALYGLFPLWTALSGTFDIWWETKTWLIRRITGVLQDSGIARPGVSLLNTFLTNLPDYWPWYLAVALAGVLAVAYLYYYYRHGVRDLRAELLAAMVLGTYAFFVVVRVLGGVINEQYFYSLMPFVALTLAYAALEGPRFLAARRQRPSPANRAARQADGQTTLIEVTTPAAAAGRFGRWRMVPLVVLGLLLAYNAGAWAVRYVMDRDDSYVQVDRTLAAALPPGTAIVGRDLLDLYLMPKQAVYTFSYLNLTGRSAEPANILDRRIPYVILNDQSLLQRYGGANPRYYEWVQQNGREASRFEGRRYNTYVYEIDYTRPVETFGENSIAVGKPAFASSSEHGDRLGPQNAVDAGISTRWASQPGQDETWLYVDLGASTAFSQAELHWESAFAQEYELQVSEDAQNWTTFYRTTEGAGGSELIEQGATGRYVRLLMIKRGSPYGYSLWEFSIYP